jgi:hypothetical protein
MNELPNNLINWDFQSRINQKEREREAAFRDQFLKQQRRSEDRELMLMVAKAAALTAIAIGLIIGVWL